MRTSSAKTILMLPLIFLGLSLAWGMKLNPGDIVAVDYDNSGVVRVDPLTGEQEIIVQFLLGPQYLAVETSGMIIVADESMDAILRIDPETGEVEILAEAGIQEPTGVAIEADGGIIISERYNSKVYRVDPVTGELSILAIDGPPLDTPTGLAIEAGGGIVTADGNAGVVRVDPDVGGDTLVTPHAPLLFFPHGIDVEASGALVVTETSDGNLVRVHPQTGEQSLITAFPFDDPLDVAVEADGNLIVSTDGAGIFRVDPVSGVQTLLSSLPSGSFVGVAVVPQLGPALRLSGTCPGEATLEVSNATPGAPIALAFGTVAGAFTVPQGRCAGATLRIANPSLLSVVNADGTGTVSITRSVGQNACGLLIQAADLTTCTPTNAVFVP